MLLILSGITIYRKLVNAQNRTIDFAFIRDYKISHEL